MDKTTNDKNLVSKFRPFECDICMLRFDEKTHLRQHIGHKHLPKDRKCPDCDVMINSISIVSHQQTHRKKHICEKCGRLFQTAKRLEAHMEKFCSRYSLERDPEFLGKKFKCIMCMYRGPNERALNKHVQRVHRSKNMEKTKTCKICNKQFNKIAYTYHVRTHGRIQCEKCLKWLSAGSGFFKQHMLNHEKEENESGDPKSHERALGSDGIYRCYGENCDYETHKKRLFVRHWQNKHGPKLLKCDYPGCDSGLMSEKQLWRHKNTHKRKDCQSCGALFNDLRDLNRHVAKNVCKNIKLNRDDQTNDSSIQIEPIHDLKCGKCDYTTYQANSLTRHRLHYHAPIVGKCTYPGCKNEEEMTKAKFTIHMKTHKSSCPCEFCGLVLGCKTSLKRHLRCCTQVKDISNGDKIENENPDTLHDRVLSDIKENNVSDAEKNTDTLMDVKGHVKPLDEKVLKLKVVDYKTARNLCGEQFRPTELHNHIDVCNLKQDSLNDFKNSVMASNVKLEDESVLCHEQKTSKDLSLESNHIDIKLEPEVEILEEEMIKVEPFGNIMDDPLTDSEEHSSTKENEENLAYKCNECEYQTDKKDLLKRHIQTHTRSFKCFVCVKYFANKQHLKIHILRRHPEIKNMSEGPDFTLPNGSLELITKQFRCRQCHHKSSDLHEFRCHLRDHDPVEPNATEFECTECDYSSHKKRNLQYHILMNHDPASQNCEICGKRISKQRFRKHMRVHNKPFECPLCSKRVANRWNLKEHIKNQHPGRQDLIDEINEDGKAAKKEKKDNIEMQCAHCDYITDERRNFVNHFSRMHATIRCTCHYCGQSISRIDIRRHIASHENPPQKTSYMCEKCSRVFAQKRSLEVHILSCSGQIKLPNTEIFKCDMCDYATGTKKSLRNHKYMVHAPKNSQCPICSKMMTKAKLSSHIRWHENRLTCSLCQKANFASRWHLKVHILKVHPGNEQLMADEGLLREAKPCVSEVKEDEEGTVACPECGKTIKKKRISKHMQIHNKQFSCSNDGCTKLFANKYSLQAHLKRCKSAITDR